METNDFLRVVRAAVVNEMATEGAYVTNYSYDPGGITVYGVTVKNFPDALKYRTDPEKLASYASQRILEVLKSRGLQNTSPWQAVFLETAHVWWGPGRRSFLKEYHREVPLLRSWYEGSRNLPVGGVLEHTTSRFLRFCKKSGLPITNYRRKVERAVYYAIYGRWKSN